MERFHIKSVAVIVAAFLFLHSVIGCGSSHQSVNIYSQYDALEYSEEITLSAGKESVFIAAIHALEDRGYIITLSDPVAGLLNAEYSSSNTLPEEQQALEHQAYQEDHAKGFITFLGIILLVGLVAEVLSSPHHEQPEKQESCRQDEHLRNFRNDYGYRYVTTISAKEINKNASVVRVSVVKMEIEHGAVKNSFKLYNKYLNYSLFDDIKMNVSLARR